MVPRAESAELAAATLARPVRDLAGVGPVEAAARLDSLEVVGHTVPPLDRPRGAARQDLVQSPRVERQRAARADARRDRRVERVHQSFHPGGDVGGVKRALHEAHAAVDVEPARGLRHAVGAGPEAVEPERLDREATDRVEADVAEEERARAAGESRAEPGGEEPEHHEVPDRLVEEGRVEVLVLAEAERAVWRRDVELPRKIRRSAERLFVEEVPPASDRLAERDRGGRDVETAEDWKPPVIRQPRADEGTQDQPAVDREPALPDGDDLPWVPAVVIPVEENLVEPRSHEAREDRPLPAADDVVGRQVVASGLTMAEPEAGDDRRRHENAVPAEDHGTNLECDRAGRADHGVEDNTARGEARGRGGRA